MSIKTRLMISALPLTLAFAIGVQAAGPGVDDRVAAEAADRAQLQEIAAFLADPDARERFAAVCALVDLASMQTTSSQEISDLLEIAARDRDPEIARLAAGAFYEFEMRAQQPPETQPDAELQELAKALEFEEIAVILNDPRSRERFRAAVALTDLALSYKVLPYEMLDLLETAREDEDFEIARLAETALAQHEGRPMDPSFDRQPVVAADQPFVEKRADDPFAKLADPNPNLRYDALVHLMEIAPKDGRAIDPKILKAFTEAATDADPRVRSYAEFAIGGGLAGDENAMAQVYVGPTETMAWGDPQPPSAPKSMGGQQYPGVLDEHGVFIGVIEAPHGGSQQPAPPEYAEAKQHQGAFDEHGVFVGVTMPPIDTERQPE